MTCTYGLSPVLVFFVVRTTSKTWDYGLTMTIVHIALCCAVSVTYPANWIWWVTIATSTMFLIVTGALLCYYLRDMREIRLE